MARSRVGGSTAKLSGKVGDVIYSITRNPDGTFRQMVSANPEERFNPNTDAQARARMTMAMIERAMFTYRDFMGTGFEGVDLGTDSVSKFSEVNYNKVKYDIDVYWDVEDWPDWDYDFPKKGVSAVKDGCFIISQGSLRDNLNFWPYGTYGERHEFGFDTLAIGESPTVEKFLYRNGLKPGMQYVAIFFCQGTTPSKSFVAWLMIWTEETVNLNAQLNNSNWRNYIKTNSNVLTNAYFTTSTGQLTVKCDQLAAYSIQRTGCFGHRLRIREKGRFLYNNCEMMWNTYPSPQVAWGWKTLWQVKDSWIEQPVPPEPPTPLLPKEYQQVTWIKRLADLQWRINNVWNPKYCSIETVLSIPNNGQNYIFGGASSVERGRLRLVGSNLRWYLSNSLGEPISSVIGSVIYNQFLPFKYSPYGNGYKIESGWGNVTLDSFNYQSDDSLKNLVLFGLTNNVPDVAMMRTKIKDIRNNQLIADLVPCYRKSDNIAGMYDLVSDSFFCPNTNVGDFQFGDPVY